MLLTLQDLESYKLHIYLYYYMWGETTFSFAVILLVFTTLGTFYLPIVKPSLKKTYFKINLWRAFFISLTKLGYFVETFSMKVGKF